MNLGDKVILEITATDTDHGFGLSAFNIDQNLPQGQTVTIEFVADRKANLPSSARASAVGGISEWVAS